MVSSFLINEKVVANDFATARLFLMIEAGKLFLPAESFSLLVVNLKYSPCARFGA